MPIKCSVPGIHTVYNSLAAASVALLDNVSPEAVCQGIKNMKKIDGRLEKIFLPDSSFSVFIDYAHTPAAMENLFLTVRSLNSKNGRIITLFGCGGDRDKSKRAPMGRIASLYSDLVIITDDNPRREDPESIIGDILSGIDKTKPYKVVRGREKAIEYAIENARQNDIILLVGKGHEQYEIQNNEIKPFSEKEIVNRIIKSKAGGKNERKI
jgi:UDP-N-acetylmuramoyl-L-alanyl-D-glutamate--2,6-diaminopimelate ligase